ncbi:hypothetical protein [Streptomyces niveus]
MDLLHSRQRRHFLDTGPREEQFARGNTEIESHMQLRQHVPYI